MNTIWKYRATFFSIHFVFVFLPHLRYVICSSVARKKAATKFARKKARKWRSVDRIYAFGCVGSGTCPRSKQIMAEIRRYSLVKLCLQLTRATDFVLIFCTIGESSLKSIHDQSVQLHQTHANTPRPLLAPHLRGKPNRRRTPQIVQTE